jgi:GNAT superfamily N-acetyltransferase
MDLVLTKKLRRNIQDYGWPVTLQKGLAYPVQLVFARRVYRIYRIDLARATTAHDRDVPGLAFRLLNPDDHDAIRQIEENHEWLRGQLKEKIRAGGLCLAAFEGARLAGFNLVGFGEVDIPLLNMRRAFHKGDAWSEHIAVERTVRQKGCGSLLRYRIFDELRKRGYRRLYGGALTSNSASLALARKVGFREIVDIRYTRILGKDSWQYQRVVTQ